MPTKPHDFQPLDPGRVNPSDPVEMSYWCAELHCTEKQLNAAISAVGEHVTEIRAEIERQRKTAT